MDMASQDIGRNKAEGRRRREATDEMRFARIEEGEERAAPVYQLTEGGK